MFGKAWVCPRCNQPFVACTGPWCSTCRHAVREEKRKTPYSLKRVEDFVDKLTETYCNDELLAVFRELSKPESVEGKRTGRLLSLGWYLLSAWEQANVYHRLCDLVQFLGQEQFKRYTAVARALDDRLR